MSNLSNQVNTIAARNLKIVNIYTGIGGVYTIFFSVFFRFVSPNSFLFTVHTVAFLGIIVNYFIVRRTLDIERGVSIVLALATAIMLCLFATGGWGNMGIIWPFAFLPAAFFMNKGKGGRAIVAILFSGCLTLAVLHIFNIIALPYSNVTLINYFAAMLIFIVLMVLYQNATINYEFYLTYRQKFFETGLDALIVVDGNCTIYDVNHVAEEITSTSKEKLCGTDLASCFAEPEKIRDTIKKALNDGKVYNFPLSIRQTSSDSNIDLLINATAYEDEIKKENRIFVVMRDITQQNLKEAALKETEGRFYLLIEGVKDYAIYMMDVNGLIVSWNAGAQNIKRYSSEEIIGRHHSIFYSPEEIQKGEPDYYLKMAKEQGQIESEGWRIRKDGTRYWANEIFTALYDNTGNLYGFSKITRDVTERRETEQKQTELVVELEKANKELESFSYSVSHDLRAPLRSISAYTKILEEDYMENMDDEGKRTVYTILRNSKYMGQLIDDLLDFSHIGKKELSPSLIDMNSMVAAICQDILPIETRGTTQIKIAKLPKAFGDYGLLRQVWTNLVSNALKFSSPERAIIIEIGSNSSDEMNEYFIKDNGVGFDMRFYDKLFGVFQRLHSQEEFGGTGVGLAIIKRIITKHHGKIWAESKLNEGTTLYFTLSSEQLKKTINGN